MATTPNLTYWQQYYSGVMACRHAIMLQHFDHTELYISSTKIGLHTNFSLLLSSSCTLCRKTRYFMCYIILVLGIETCAKASVSDFSVVCSHHKTAPPKAKPWTPHDIDVDDDVDVQRVIDSCWACLLSLLVLGSIPIPTVLSCPWCQYHVNVMSMSMSASTS